MNEYIALLRGINVGGNNIIKMADLRACLEAQGFQEVKTYIQSGNVLFQTKENDREKLVTEIEELLSKTFNYHSRVVVISADELRQTVREAPKNFGNEPDKYRYNVIFIKPPLQAKEAIKQMETREGVDEVAAGKHALYFSHLISKAGQSKLSQMIKSPIYKHTTVRNWNTTSKLLAML